MLTMKQRKLDWRIICTAILTIGVIEVVALFKGIDGALLVLAVGAIAGLAGFVVPSPFKIK